MTTSNDLFLGVDGGQSSTKALIGDAGGRVIGRGTAGPCNHVSAEEARAKFLRTIRECVSAACADAGLGAETRFRAACFGMSGGPEDKAALLREAVTADEWLVTHDGLIALSGALAGADGMVAIAGTGQIAFGRNGTRMMRAGGWGYVFGDEGGAFWIVREALRAALCFEEGWGMETALLAALLKATVAGNANELLHWFYTPEWPRSKVAKLAVEVARVAEEGDAVAREVLRSAGEKLASFVSPLRAQLWQETGAVPASFIGGVFRNGMVLASFTEALERDGRIVVRPPVWGADRGALIEAFRLAGLAFGTC